MSLSDAKAGTRTAVIGPTAAGKTQLLYLLTGLIKPDSGTVEFDGKPWTLTRRKRCTGRSASSFRTAILFNLTLRENIAFNTAVTDAGYGEGDSDCGASGLRRFAARRSWTRSFPNAEPVSPADRSNASCWRARWH